MGRNRGSQMIDWKTATRIDQRIFKVVARALDAHPYLMEFIFDPVEPKLRCLPEELLNESGYMSAGEDLLVRVALDLWSGSGNAHIWELVEILDDTNFTNVLWALLAIGTKFNGWDGPVTRQLKLDSE